MGMAMNPQSGRRGVAGGLLPGCTYREIGFSLIEILIASVLFLAMALGIVPLFTQAMSSNVAGFDATESTNFTRSQVEQLMQLPFDSPLLDVNTDAPETAYFSASQHAWIPGQPPTDGSDQALWRRTTTIRQYHISAVTDGFLDAQTEALDPGVDPSLVHFKEIEVRLENERHGLLAGPADGITFRVLKSQ